MSNLSFWDGEGLLAAQFWVKFWDGPFIVTDHTRTVGIMTNEFSLVLNMLSHLYSFCDIYLGYYMCVRVGYVSL